MGVKVTLVCFGFGITSLSDCLKSLPYFLNQSNKKLKLIVTCARFPPLNVFASSFDWFTKLSVSFVTGQSNYFGSGVSTLNRKPLEL